MIGETLSHYKILDKLGAGGMGEVYRAEDTTLDREVALKILPPELAESQERLDRFQREAKTLAALDHPNIVHIHTVEEEDGVHFLTMQLVEGKPLSHLIPRGGMPLERIFEIAVPLADALATAHEKGVIHRDLKPANIMVTDEGRVKVLDFGLAKLRQEAEVPLATELPTEPLTEEGTIVGTMPYMSPEQLEGKEIDARSDIFSLGVVLYELATGERPFTGDSSASLIMSIGRDTPPDVDSMREELPRHLGRVVRHCLEKDPTRRFQTAKDVRNELEDLRREETSSVVAPTAPKPEPKVSRTKSLLLLAAGTVAVLATVVAMWLGGKQGPSDESEDTPVAPPMIVVLPFENLGAPEDEYFADGMTEEITSRLAVVSGLRVISRTSAMQYKKNRPSLKQVGEELGVDYVLEGTVRWARTAEGHGRVRITPQLIRVEDDSHLWATSYDEVIDDIFDIQASIAKSVIDQLAVTLVESEDQEQTASPTDSIEAYQAYLRGAYLRHQLDFSQDNNEAIIHAFERAVELDSDFAEAHAGLARAHAMMVHMGFDTTEERRRASWEAAERALGLAPDSPRVLMGAGFYHLHANKEYEQALEYFAQAARAVPSDFEPIYAIALVQRRLGRLEEGVESLKEAIALSPRDGSLPGMLCQFLRDMRRYEEAVDNCDKSIALQPIQSFSFRNKALVYLLWKGDTRQARAVWEASPLDWQFRSSFKLLLFERDYHALLEELESKRGTWHKDQQNAYPLELEQAQVLLLAGEGDLALAAFEQAQEDLEKEIVSTLEDHRLHSALGIAQAGLGHKESAIGNGHRGVELMPLSKDAFNGDNRLYDLALIYVMVTEPDLAVDQLEVLLSIPSQFSVPWFRLDPRLDPLRDHPRFQALLEKYGQEG